MLGIMEFMIPAYSIYFKVITCSNKIIIILILYENITRLGKIYFIVKNNLGLIQNFGKFMTEIQDS